MLKTYLTIDNCCMYYSADRREEKRREEKRREGKGREGKGREEKRREEKRREEKRREEKRGEGAKGGRVLLGPFSDRHEGLLDVSFLLYGLNKGAQSCET